jgi:ParB family chromosome partitioning protein
MAVDVSQETLKGKPGKHRCPHCTYSAMTAGSLNGHLAMAHPDAEVEAGPTDDELEDLGIPVELQRAVERGEAEEEPEIAFGLAGPMGQLREIPIDQIEVATNVREDVGQIAEMAGSIRDHGLLEPITVTALYGAGLDEKPTGYRVLAGHRRLAAATLAGETKIRAIVDPRLELGETGIGRSVVQLVENVQRADLNPLDIAKAMSAIAAARPSMTHADIAKLVQKDRSWVTNTLRLLETAPVVQEAVRAGSLSATHARAIAAVDVDLQAGLLETVVERGLSAKATEQQAQHVKESGKRIREHEAGVAKRAAEAIAMLDKVAQRDASTICVEDFYTGDEVKKALTADGWKVTNGGGVDVIAQAGSCGCAGVWRLAIPYNDNGHVTLHPACNSSDHKAARKAALDAQWKADVAKGNEERRVAREAEQAAAGRLRAGIVDILAEQPPTPLARRLTLYALLEGEIDQELADEYLQGETAGLLDLDDAPWTLLEGIPDEDLAGIQSKAIVDFVGGFAGGPGVRAAIAAWLLAHGRGEEAPKPAAVKPDRKRLGKDVRLQDPVVIGGHREYVVIAIVYPGQDPAIVDLVPPDYTPGRPIAARHHVMLADLVADTKARVWRAPALVVEAPSVAAVATETAGQLDELTEPLPLVCVGSNHVPGCVHQGGEVPPARPAPAAS